jgi:hypothetical protein
MNELDFRTRLYTDPQAADQELLDAAAGDPVLQKILDQTRELDTEVAALLSSVTIPAGLADELMAIPATASTDSQNLEELAAKPAANNNFFQYYAVAASLLLALGITFSVTFNSSSPTGAELAVGDDILQHLYMDAYELEGVSSNQITTAFGMPALNSIMAESGTRLVSNEFLQELPILSAKPCKIVPSFDSAHLIFSGTQGAVSVIVINNSPVSGEYKFSDDRFSGLVLPRGEGNMVLVGESGEDLEQYKDLFAENIDWVI